ncbi:MAG: hybrid sensor histidine kinase/response regulator [Pleurocapsa sp. MO_226.B13]|nr:hybrid sensor histidine kinase/response regulator [Pleurocapsa sp. MO_226.B13]
MSKNTNTQTILIVDDNSDQIELLSRILTREGRKISMALDGEAALEQIKYFLPDLILLDVTMPKMDGYQTCLAIKANPDYRDIPIIFLTALSDTDYMMKGFALGAVDYINKPFHLDEVRARVRVHLKLRQMTKTLASQNFMLNNALKQEKKLNELKSRFVTMASHEFRTPLASILSSAELLEHYSHKWSEEKKLSHLYRIQSSVKHITELLNDVLLLGKADAGKLKLSPSRFNLFQFCQELVAEIQLTTTTHQINFQVENCSPASDCEQKSKGDLVCMDEKLLRQILTNLLSNAVKYSPESDKVDFSLTYQSKQAVFQVRDFGIGIPPEEQNLLFESFHRAVNVGSIPGTGLGLPIVKRAVDLHGGTISIASQLGLGTTFTVALPYLAAE